MALKTPTKKSRKKVIVHENSKLDFFKTQYLEPEEKKSRTKPTEDDTLARAPEMKNGKPKRKKKMSEAHLLEIIKADPTSIVDEGVTSLDNVKKVGGYTQWLVNQYFNLIPKDFLGKKDERYANVKQEVSRFFEDLYKVKEDLNIFHRFNKRVKPETKRDIGKVKDSAELYDLIKDIDTSGGEHFMSDEKKEKRKRLLQNGSTVEYEDDKWEVIIPSTPEASFELAGGGLSRWCTAQSRHSNQHQHYSKDGPLYIIRDKKDIVSSGHGQGMPRPLYQFHFPSQQYMDREDRSISVVDFLDKKGNEGLKSFFKPVFEGAWNHKNFEVEDRTFQAYSQLYGLGEDTLKLVRKLLQNKISQHDDVVANDDGGEYKGFIKVLKHEEFIKNVFEFIKPTITVLEIQFKNYQGKGIDIPEKVGTLSKVTNLVLSGFVKSLPESIGGMTNLELIALADNPQLKSLPNDLGKCKKLNVVNVTHTTLAKKIPASVRELEKTGDLLIVDN